MVHMLSKKLTMPKLCDIFIMKGGINMKRVQILSSNALKLIGAVFMVCDHLGMIFFPNISALRMIGRLTFPVFAFCIAQGTRYTKNRLKYFLLVLSLGIVCQIPLAIVAPSAYLNVLITFALAIVICYALDYLKKALICDTVPHKIALGILLLVLSVLAPMAICTVKRMEYGVLGCMMPALASLFYMPSDAPPFLKRLDTSYVHVLMLGVGTLCQAVFDGGKYQILALLSIPILLMYSGKRGRLKMKYFFYIFYPAHMVILYGIYFLIQIS